MAQIHCWLQLRQAGLEHSYKSFGDAVGLRGFGKCVKWRGCIAILLFLQ